MHVRTLTLTQANTAEWENESERRQQNNNTTSRCCISCCCLCYAAHFDNNVICVFMWNGCVSIFSATNKMLLLIRSFLFSYYMRTMHYNKAMKWNEMKKTINEKIFKTVFVIFSLSFFSLVNFWMVVNVFYGKNFMETNISNLKYNKKTETRTKKLQLTKIWLCLWSGLCTMHTTYNYQISWCVLQKTSFSLVCFRPL